MSSAGKWNLRRVFRLPSTRRRLHDDVEAELAFHLEGRVEELMREGLTRENAVHEARRRFGDYARIEREVERMSLKSERRRTLRDRVDAVRADLRYSARALARQPIYVAVVVLTLTLGVGATAAMFHAVDRVILHPLPYPDADRIIYLATRWGKERPMGAVSPGRFQFFHENSRIFDGLATFRTFEAQLGDDETGIAIEGVRVTPDFFNVIGAKPLFGRGLVPRDYEPGAPPVAILGHALWTTRFGADSGVVGRAVHLGGRLYSVVGVLPASFEIAEVESPTAVVVPLVFSAEELTDRGANYTSIGRRRRGVTDAQIAEDVASVFAAFRRQFPDRVEKDDAITVMTYEQIFAGDLVSELWIMLGATLFVFLLACANVANIVYARALTRSREFAVRVALGAGRSRIVRQVLVEMVLLGIVSTITATAASLASVRGLVALARGALLRESQLRLDPRVVVATTIVALAASLIIGLVVGLAATRAGLTRSLVGSTRTSGLGGSAAHRGARGFLVGLESALAMVLLAGAGLLISSFVKVLSVDGGFRREGVYTATIPRAPRDYSKGDVTERFERRVLEQLRATPGIMSAGATASLPLRRGMNIPTTVQGHAELSEGATEWRAVSPGYLAMMDIRLVAGRDIKETDAATSPPVVLVSQAYAKRFLSDGSPIGRRILVGCYKGCPDRQPTPLEVVGVVSDLRDASLEQPRLRRTIWVPWSQSNADFARLPAFVVRANDPAVAASALRRAIAAADPRIGSPDVAAMTDIVSASLSWRRFSTVLMTCFAGLALVLTCVGIYGVAAYAVSQRTQEIGLRMALGARPAGVVALVVRQGVTPAAFGLVVGLGMALLLTRVLSKLLFGIGPRDPLSFASVALVLLGVAVAASYLPARRAARVDPAGALRAE
jgi:putative ABC transport system permease protein